MNMRQQGSIKLFYIQKLHYRINYEGNLRQSALFSLFPVFVVVFFSRCEMEKQILGKVNGNFTYRICESHNSQVTSNLFPCAGIKNSACFVLVEAEPSFLSQQGRWVYFN